MLKLYIFCTLLTAYLLYTFTVYSRGTEETARGPLPDRQLIELGKQLYQRHNCTACHQLYGLGGYLGPELTTAYSDPNRGELYIRALLQNGGPRMPNFHFNENEISAIISYLKYVDNSAISYRKQ